MQSHQQDSTNSLASKNFSSTVEQQIQKKTLWQVVRVMRNIPINASGDGPECGPCSQLDACSCQHDKSFRAALFFHSYCVHDAKYAAAENDCGMISRSVVGEEALKQFCFYCMASDMRMSNFLCIVRRKCSCHLKQLTDALQRYSPPSFDLSR